MTNSKIKIKAIEDYSWWTVGNIYDVIDIETTSEEKWYKILDDNGEVAELSDIRNVDEFEIEL